MTALLVAWGWVAGILVGARLGPDAGTVTLAALSAAAGAAAVIAAPGSARTSAIVVTAGLLGIVRATLAPVVPPPELLSLPGEAMLVGRVGDVPAVEGRMARFPLDVSHVELPDSSRDGSCAVNARVLVLAEAGAVEYGDLVAVRGRISEPRSRAGYPRAEILAARGISLEISALSLEVRDPAGPSVMSGLYAVRRALERSVREALPEPHASLAAGVVLGARSTMPPELKTMLAATGTSHIVAVSGFNVAILAAAVQLVGVRTVGRPWAYVPMFIVTWAYTVLVGSPPSAVRAAVMASLVFLAQAVGRLPEPTTILALASAGLLAYDPRLAGDLSFQLSVAATAGLILFSQPLADRFRRLPPVVRDGVSVAIAAQIATLPIALGTFHTLPALAPLSNLLIGFAIPWLMLVGGLLALLGALPGFGELLAWGTWGLASYVLVVVEWCARLPGAVVYTGRLPPLLGLAWLAALSLWAALGSAELPARWTRLAPRAAFGAIPLLLVPLGTLVARPEPPATTIQLMDSGGSDVLVVAEGGRTMLLSDGRSSGMLASAVAERLDFWQPRLDVVALTRSELSERSGVLETVRRYPPDLTVVPSSPKLEESEESSRLVGAGPDLRVDLGSDVSARVVDARIQDGRSTIDVELATPSVLVWLPGAGPPSPLWRSAPRDRRPIVLRVVTVSREWRALIAELPISVVITERPLALDRALALDHQTYGSAELRDRGGKLELSVDRCPSGRGCPVEPPT